MKIPKSLTTPISPRPFGWIGAVTLPAFSLLFFHDAYIAIQNRASLDAGEFWMRLIGMTVFGIIFFAVGILGVFIGIHGDKKRLARTPQ